MKKIYTVLAGLMTVTSIAQSVPSSTLVNGTFGSSSKPFTTDDDKANLYYSIGFPFQIKKVASNNTESTFFSSANFCITPGIAIKGNKAIVTNPPLGNGTTKVYLLNGVSKDSITLNTNTTYCFNKFPVNNTFGYFNDSSRIYKTNYTAAGTNNIVPLRNNTFINAIKEKNDNLITYEAIKNTSGNSYDRRFLYFYNGISYAKFDSANIVTFNGTYFQLFTNPSNKDIYAIKQPGSPSDSLSFKIWKFNGTGTPTVLNINTTRRLVQVTTMLNDKIIGLVFNNGNRSMVSIDVNTGNLSYITTGNILNTNPYYGYWFSNGNVAYFLQSIAGIRVPCVTNGITADTITTKSGIGTSTIWNGDFCGNDFWSVVGSQYTVIFKPNKTFSVVNINNNPLNIITYDPMFADNHMYFRNAGNNSTVFELYKAACTSQIGINENTISTDNFSFYPNPTSSILNVKLENITKPEIIVITNILGEVVLTETATTQHSTLSTQHLNSGVYFLQVGNSKAVKFIKN